MAQLDKNNSKIRRWHGKCSLALLLSCSLADSNSVQAEMKYSELVVFD
jgi:hypothetical protein